MNTTATLAPAAPETKTHDGPILSLKGLKKHFPVLGGLLRREKAKVRAVDGIDLEIKRGETLSLVGESGSGKSTVGRMITSLDRPTQGSIQFHASNSAPQDIAQADAAAIKALRRDIQLIFQDPYSSLNPRMTTEQVIAEPLRNCTNLSRAEIRDKVRDQMLAVGLRADQMKKYPHEFSGGQRQRIGIARALILRPQLVVLDEPVSALDTSVQAQVLNLLKDIQAELNPTYLFISHDLSVVKHISDRIAVMYLGRIVEIAETSALFANPQHPYTEALISVTPAPNPRRTRRRIILEGDVPSPVDPPSGCPFHPRCRYAADQCRQATPALRDMGNGHLAACHHSETLTLQNLSEAQK